MIGTTKNVPVSQFITQLLGQLLFVLDHVLKNIFLQILQTLLCLHLRINLLLKKVRTISIATDIYRKPHCLKILLHVIKCRSQAFQNHYCCYFILGI